MIPVYARALALGLLLIPVLTFGVYIWKNAVNMPYADDEALLYTLNYVYEHGRLFTSLLHQHNDHRIVFSRLAGVVIRFFTGSMNFRTMIILGYLNLVLLGHSFFLVYRSFRKDLLFFLPTSVLLFSPILYCTQLWSITAFEQTLSIAFSLYSLYFLQPEKQKIWYISIPFAIAATLANLDGMSVIPIALFWLIVQRRNRESLIFALFSVCYCYVFFLGFRFSSASHFPELSKFLSVVVKGFIALSGSIVKVLSDSYGYQMAFILGAFIFLTYIYFTARKFYKVYTDRQTKYEINFTEICFFKVLACVLMIALGRSGDAADDILSIRFQIYSASVFVIFYLFVLNNLKQVKLEKLFFLTFLTASLTLNLLAYVKYNNAVRTHNDQLMVDNFNYTTRGFFMYQYFASPQPEAGFYNHYKFPEYFKKYVVSAWHGQLQSQHPVTGVSLKTEVLKTAVDYPESLYPVIRFQFNNLPAIVPGRNVYLALSDRGKNFFLLAVRPPMSGWFRELMGQRNSRNSLSASFPKKIASDFYDVSLCWTVNNVPHSMLVARNINIGR